MTGILDHRLDPLELPALFGGRMNQGSGEPVPLSGPRVLAAFDNFDTK